ncbi:MAG: hypothetical protein ACI86H_000698 [bacterium]|jgi:hypothetical protein
MNHKLEKYQQKTTPIYYNKIAFKILYLTAHKPNNQVIYIASIGYQVAHSSKLNKYKLYLDVVPHKAKIRFINHNMKFTQNMKLSAGTYRLKISKDGFKPTTISIPIQKRDLDRHIKIKLLMLREHFLQ